MMELYFVPLEKRGFLHFRLRPVSGRIILSDTSDNIGGHALWRYENGPSTRKLCNILKFHCALPQNWIRNPIYTPHLVKNRPLELVRGYNLTRKCDTSYITCNTLIIHLTLRESIDIIDYSFHLYSFLSNLARSQTEHYLKASAQSTVVKNDQYPQLQTMLCVLRVL